MTHYSMHPLLRRWLAGVLAVQLGLSPLATPAYAALTPLADEPLAVKSSAKPNIVLTVDDSTSMLFDFLPDFVANVFCRDGTGNMNSQCGFTGAPIDAGSGGKYISPQYIWEQFNFPFPAYGGGYSNSGPGAGCNLVGIPPTCSGGISPGPLPGILNYPAASGSPSAGKPYEYWLLWPAPAHNAALNALYYDPRLTYDPPVDSTGASYPQMDAAGSSNWTAVPADTWASTVTNVDLTATVTIGQWCNSDWTQGNDDSGVAFVTNPGHCRSNGLIAAASAGSPAATGDYMYPWTPVNITPNDCVPGTFPSGACASKVDWSVVKLSPATNAAIKPAAWNAAAQDNKFFYQNENVLWCDITSTDWPQSGPSQPQTCNNVTNPQVCNPNAIQPTCSGAVAGVCTGGTNAGVCNGAATTGNCGGFVAGRCQGNQAGVCTGQPGVCAGGAAGTCSVNATCTAGTPAACNGATREACVGGSPASCNNIVPQACNGATQTTCNPVAQTCNGAQAQTCVNIVSHPPPPSSCTSAWVPLGCNLDPNPEGTCIFTTTCPPPQVYGNCSVQTATQCTLDSQCPFINGTCSVAGNSCSSNANCSLNRCAGASSGSCNVNTDCPSTGGTCASTAAACTINAGVSSCPASGNCNNAPNPVCTVSPGTCPVVTGHCATTVATACTPNGANSPSCPVVPNSGACNNPPNSPCTTAATCPAITSKCSNAPATNCTVPATSCPMTGVCSNGAGACNANAGCPGAAARCTNPLSPRLGQLCASAAFCDKVGVCTNNLKPPGTPCTLASQCTVVGACTAGLVGLACAVNANPSVPCQKPGACTTGNVGAACTVPTGTPTVQCAKNGTCSNSGVACTVATQAVACVATKGTCTAGLVGTPCALGANASCNKSAVCGQSLTNGANCTTTAQCTPLQGTCSVSGNACTTAANCVNTGTCSITGAICTAANAATVCTNQPGPLDPRNARCDTTGVTNNPLTTLLADANGTGKTCRRNNHAYAGVTAGQFNYPSGKFTTPVTGEIVPGSGLGCFATNRYVNAPRHYWKTEVQWCDKKIATANNEWLGYGTDAGGTCQPGKDLTHVYPRFFQFGKASYVNNDVDIGGTAAFQRVDLDISKQPYIHTWVDVNGQTQTVTRSFAQEMTNYANWFAYYHTRILAVKTVTSLTFDKLDDLYRVGFHTLSNGLTTSAAQSDPSKFVNIDDFDAAQKAAWFKELFAIQIPLGLETPTLDAMARIGDYFLQGTSASLAGATDPIILSCQKNFHMLFTDGFTNQAALPAITVADQDDTVPALPVAVTGLVTGAPWPHPFRQDPSGTAANAASDYAMNYWVTDLRPAGPNAVDNVPATVKDPASWQHLNFAAMSLGTQGKLPNANQSLTENLLAAGTLQWPQPIPNVYRPDNSGVDDLWHAAVNARGRFVNAGSADELKLGMGQILQDITNQAGSRAGVGLASSTISATNNAVYRVTFQPGWAGTVTKIKIDPVTGTQNPVPDWEASTQLSAQLTILPAPNDQPWFTNRKIFTTDDSNAGVPFLWANLSAAQQDSLAPGLPAVGQAVLEFLRGNPTNEGVSLGQFRVRATGATGENFLGDIVDSQAVFVGVPNAPYLDGNDPGYSAFVASMSGRAKMVYAGGNDGMLHAFSDATGNEAWAYIPHDLYRPDNTGLGALAYQDGALPPFRHHFYVDSTPRIVDVDKGGQNWHTMLVGGLGKGGKSYYALDVTQPASASEAAAAAQYMWTFTDADMGYSYGRPMVAKTRGFGGVWLVVVAAGYNNPSGVGTIYFIDAKTGAKLKTMTTGFGNATSPSGLAHVSGYTKDFHNQLIEQIYGGDLYGNFWRFDVSDANPGNWTVQKLAYLTDPGGNPQPITTPPQIEVDLTNGVDRWVFIGTGRLLDETDLTNTTIANQQQTFYAIRDGTTSTPNPIVTALLPRADFDPLTDKINGLTAKPAKGWFDDLPAGERVITAVQAALSVVAYVGTSPQDNPCLTGLPATLYVREFAQGESLLFDASNNPIAGIAEVQGAVGLDVAIFSDSTGPQSANSLDIRIAVTAGTTGNVFFQRIRLPAVLSAHRMSWRLLGQ